jgi:hydrogenase/urease accessory protein HupE
MHVDASFGRDHTYVIEVTSKRPISTVEVCFDGQCKTAYLHGRFVRGANLHAESFAFSIPSAFVTYSLTTTVEGHDPQTQWIDADDRSAPVSLSMPSRGSIARQYLVLGFTHIVPRGLDHILFILGIFLLSMKLKPVLAQVTAFTVAHSITLGLTMYGIVSLSPRIVEPLIALSIAYIAVENLMTTEVRASRIAIVFAFGLLHGMGFAGVLKELGLPRSEFLTALLTFNLGVELGQLAVIASAWLLFGWWIARQPSYRRRYLVPASVMIALTGAFWTVQRLLA